MKLKTIATALAVLATCGSFAQQFNYTLSTDNSVSYAALNSQTILNSGNQSWAARYKIPIGFTFNYLGQNFDSLTIETNGYLCFDHDRHYTFTALNNFGDRVDSTGTHAVLGYASSGTSGNRILKIQYYNVGQAGSDAAFNYQVWLKENGQLQLVIGSHTYDTGDTTQNVRIGLLNANMDTPVRGLLLTGNTQSPTGQPIDDNNPDPVFLHSIPAAGTRYTFTPIN